jgi:hypothetical protein
MKLCQTCQFLRHAHDASLAAQAALGKKLSIAVQKRDAARTRKVTVQLERRFRDRERAREVIRLHPITVHKG